MHKVILMLFLLSVILSPIENNNYYFPLIVTRPGIGIAWYATPHSQDHAEKLGAYYWYNSQSYLQNHRQAIPILRPAYWNRFVLFVPTSYSGIMLIGNEGEFEGQDNLTPYQMRDFILEARQQYPLANFVCLNSYDILYINAVLSLLPDQECLIIGVHIYDNVNISNHLDLVNRELFWITEIGWSNNDHFAYDVMYSLTSQIKEDHRIQRVFAYTTSEANHPSVNMIDDSGNVLPNGQGFIEGLAYP